MIRRAAWKFYILIRALAHPVVFGATGAVFDQAGRILLVRHRYRRGWHLPGGGVARGEAPEAAVRRELAEEVGLSGGQVCFFGLYTASLGLTSNVIALYRITGAITAFKPSLEISEALFADPSDPPPGCTPATLRRLAELTGRAPTTPWW